jgi:hypothetical protein
MPFPITHSHKEYIGRALNFFNPEVMVVLYNQMIEYEPRRGEMIIAIA